MEVGLHEMDGLHPTDGKTKIFTELGLFDSVDFLAVPEFYRFMHGKTDLVMPHDRASAEALLKENFPDQSDGIAKYFERLMNARRINVMERDQPDISIGEYLDSIFTSEEIKLFLLGNLGYFHDDPYSLSLRYFAMAESAYFNGRANFIKGGSQELSNKMVEIIRANGGKVLLNHRVSSVLCEGDRIIGVKFINVLPGNHVEAEARAEKFIANAALPRVAEMIQSDKAKDLENELSGQAIGASLLTVYFGFSKSLKELGHTHYSTFVFDDSITSQKDIAENNRSGFDTRSFTFVDYSQVDAALAPPGKSVGAVCCIDYLDDWTSLSKEEYRARKKEAAEAFTRRLEKIIPGCSEYMEHVEVGTAKTVQRYTLNPQGAVYGFAQHPNRKFTDSLKFFTNLYTASAWGKFGGGFSGAIFSGYMTATDILRGK